MLSRYAVPLLCAAAIVFACGPRPHAAESSVASARAAVPGSSTTAKPDSSGTRLSRKALREAIAREPLASTLDVSVRSAGEREVRFALHVTNRADKNVELLFPSGQTHDFVVRDAAGAEVWRWSAGRMYTQAVQSKLLAGNETTTYTESWAPGAQRGRFTVAAELRSNNHVVRQATEFVLP